MEHKIILYPNRVLSNQAETVLDFDDDLRSLVQEMFRVMYAAHGIGLAAPQIGIAKQIAVIDVSFGEEPSAKLVLINPKLERAEGFQRAREGCLSLPGFREEVKRPRIVAVRAQNENGQWGDYIGEDLLARAILHECDHLKGQLFIAHLSALKRNMINRKINKLRRAEVGRH